ncbi:MAG: hypothetical protein COB23_07605 [Methylophaga sp.]|nr:MAG: hypothetical protein COB23_07605 [Methylophaga sp.]
MIFQSAAFYRLVGSVRAPEIKSSYVLSVNGGDATGHCGYLPEECYDLPADAVSDAQNARLLVGELIAPLGGLIRAGAFIKAWFISKGTQPVLKLGKHKSLTKWKNRFKRGEWTAKDVRETFKTGKQFKADNLVNKSNSATRYYNQKLDKSIVVDDVTGEIIQLGRKGFKY